MTNSDPDAAPPSPALLRLKEAGAVSVSRLTSRDDLVDAFLASRSDRTRIAYRRDLDDFAIFLGGTSAAAAAEHLIRLDRGSANGVILAYRTDLQNRPASQIRQRSGQEKGLAAATVNRRLAAIRSCVKLARTLGFVAWELDVEGMRVEPYRDTRGPGVKVIRAMLACAEGSRDRAIIRLASERGLRRNEIRLLDVADVDQEGSRLRVLGKGRTAKVWITIAPSTLASIEEWLVERGHHPGPLVTALDRGHYGWRLSGTSIYRIVRGLGQRAGAKAQVRVHGLRHTAVTEALRATNGDVRSVAKFARHDSRVTQLYDDELRDLAGDVANKVAASMDFDASEPVQGAPT